MQNNFITKISPSVRILVLIIILVCLLLAKSIYLILFITILTCILFIITNKEVKYYVKVLKKTSILLLILLVAYIIMFRQYNIISLIIFVYKLIIGTVVFAIFIFNTNFKSMHEGLYGILLPLKKINININKLSFEITLSFYFIMVFVVSKEIIKELWVLREKKRINIIKIIPLRLIYSINKLTMLEEDLKLKFYKLNYKKINFRSKIIFLLSLILFVVCIFKEVIL